MSLECGFFYSDNGDKLYNAEQMGSFFEGLITDGIYSDVGNCMRVTPYSGMVIGVSTGRAWFNNTWTRVTAIENIQLDASDPVLNRIDAICLTINKSRDVRDNYIEVIKGTGSSGTPEKPAITSTTNTFRYPLAYVTVNKTATEITATDIESMVGTDACPFIRGIISAEAHVENSLEEMSEEIDSVNDTITNMRQTFQAGVDAVYNALVAIGITPTASTPTAIAETIARVGSGNATAAQILSGKTAFASNELLTGTMPNKGAWSDTGTDRSNVSIPQGYHNGSGSVNGIGKWDAGRAQGQADKNGFRLRVLVDAQNKFLALWLYPRSGAAWSRDIYYAAVPDGTAFEINIQTSFNNGIEVG